MDYYKLKVLNNKKEIIIGIIVILGLLGIGLYFLYNNSNDDEIVLFKENKNSINENNIDEKIIYVDIKGCVQRPGVYSFKTNEDARINDLIDKAGGLTDDADTSLINLSKKLDDEMTIIIYSHNEINEYISYKEELIEKLNLCEIKLKNNACIVEEKKTDLININDASKEELMSLSGIGESKANSIIEYRKQNKFNEISDIKNVDGIGENLFESIKNYITT